MRDGTLYLGTRRYSSWSLRGWLAVRLAGLDVDEVFIPLTGDGNTAAIKAISPTGLVPYLEHRGLRIWESLAIGEYCAEFKPSLWPAAPAPRWRARCIATEMHGGFRELRIAMSMNLGAHRPGVGHTPGALADISRIDSLWRETREGFGAGGPYLLGGDFTLADVMYAPVVARFLSYEPALSAISRAYCEAVRAHPLVAEWYAAAAAEPREWRVARYEDIT